MALSSYDQSYAKLGDQIRVAWLFVLGGTGVLIRLATVKRGINVDVLTVVAIVASVGGAAWLYFVVQRRRALHRHWAIRQDTEMKGPTQ